jgi:NADPH:quinone reductase-like Zn-dependent oxidoreductase
MKAVIYTKYGPPNVLKLTSVDKPLPKLDELLIEIHYSSVNRTDTGIRSAMYFVSRFFTGLIKPKYKILGCEFSGEVTDIGANVKNFKVGDRVFGFDDSKWGGYAEYKTIKESEMITKIPSGVDYKTATVSTEGAHYALFYIRSSGISKNSRVLINGGTGAIGSAAIQIIKSMGAHITATSPTKYINEIKKLGTDRVVDWQKEDFTTVDEKFDVVFDAVGKSSWKKCRPLLKDNGFYMSTELGKYGQNPFLALWTKLFSNKKVLFPIPKNNKEDIEYISSLLKSKKFVPLVDTTYDIKDIIEATKYVETGQKIGNVLIKVK